MGEQFFSDVVSYEKLAAEHRIIEIISGIGSGKTKWVTDLAKSTDLRILYVTSRAMVADTVANKKIDRPTTRKDSWSRNINLQTEYSRIGIAQKIHQADATTLAGLSDFITKQYSETDANTYLWEKYDVIILDEAHSLVTDATFSNDPFYVDKFLKYCVMKNKELRLILLTATDAPIKNLYDKKTRENKSFYFIDITEDCRSVNPEKVIISSSKLAEKRLISLVKDGKKAIYFANEVDRISEIKKMLISRAGLSEDEIGIDFAETSKNKKAYANSGDEIIGKEKTESRKIIKQAEEKRIALRTFLAQNEKLPDGIKVFLTTTKNKEGVTIGNEDFNYMFAESTSKCELIQMSGRIRNSKRVDLLKELVIVYNRPHPIDADKTYFEERRDETLVKYLNEAFKDHMAHYYSDRERYISDVEKKYKNIRFDMIKEKEFVIYKCRIDGLRQQVSDDRELREYIEHWNDGIKDKDISEFTMYTGKDLFIREWFPHSEVTLRINEKEYRESEFARLREGVAHYIQDNGFVGAISNEQKKLLFAWLRTYLNDFSTKWLGIGIPKSDTFGSKFQEALGIKVTQYKDHNTYMNYIELATEKEL